MDTENIEIIQFATERCYPLYQEDCNDVQKKQTAQRRYEKNKKVFIQNLLIDILLEKGFFFESKMARQSKKTFRLERITRVFYKGELLLTEEEFFIKGTLLNTYLCSLFEKDTTILLSKNNQTLLNLFGIFIEEPSCTFPL